MITIKIKTDNEAFQDLNFGHEVARILHKLADDINQSQATSEDLEILNLRDVNGNKVGRYEVEA